MQSTKAPRDLRVRDRSGYQTLYKGKTKPQNKITVDTNSKQQNKKQKQPGMRPPVEKSK